MRKTANLDIIYLKIVLFSLILTPSIRFLEGMPSLRVDDILLIFWPMLALVREENQLEGLRSGRCRVLFAMFGVFFVSFSNGILNGYEASLADFNQITRFVKYISMYLLAYEVLKNSDKYAIYKLFNFVIFCGLILFLIVVSQYFNILDLNKYYVHLVAPTQYETLIFEYNFPRPVGMIGNPNELGYLFVLILFCSLFVWLNLGSKKHAIYVIVFFLGILSTLSRSSMIALGAGIFTLVFHLLYNGGFLRKIKIIAVAPVLIAVLVGISFIPVIYDAFTWRIALIFNMAVDSSFQMRLLNWSENITIIKEHPILGVGPLRRADFFYAADNEWLLLWRSYGIVGVFVIIIFLLFSILKQKSMQVKSFEFALISSAFVYMIAAAIFYSLALFPLYLFFLAFVDTQKSNFQTLYLSGVGPFKKII